MTGEVVAVSRKAAHGIAKTNVDSINLVMSRGVEGDAHFGSTVQHRSRVAKDPNQPNSRQVHLIHAELFDELAEKGFDVRPGDMGENITTRGIDLLRLQQYSELWIGADDRATMSPERRVTLLITGLRNPCRQLEELAPGLMEAVLARGDNGELIRKAGVMATVLDGGEVRPGYVIRRVIPEGPVRPLEPV